MKTAPMILLILYRYLLALVFLCANLGHLLNLFVFTRRSFRTHPIALYFIALTFSYFILIWIFIPLRILRYGFDIDPTASSLIICKLSFFLEDCTRILIAWFLTLACLNRYCFTASNIGLRQLSTISKTYFTLSFFTLITFLLNIHLLIFYRILLEQCLPSIGIYERFLYIYRLLIHFLIPIFVMIICLILIMKNIHQSRQRISPFMIDIVYNHRIIRKKRDRNHQISRMLILQCLLWFVSMTLTFLHEIFFFFFFALPLPFILFFISSQLFRRQISKIISNLFSRQTHAHTFNR